MGNRARPTRGDEVNIIAKGKNYGWPLIGYGIDYSGAKIHETTAKDGHGAADQILGCRRSRLRAWPFYTGKLFPKWNGSLFTGALAGKMLVRLSLNGNTVTGEERLLQNLYERIRDVRQGPDGALWC